MFLHPILEPLLSAIDALIKYGESELPTSEQVEEWDREADPDAGDARNGYLPTFLKLDGSVEFLAERAGLLKRPDPPLRDSLSDVRYVTYGYTMLRIDSDGLPLKSEWLDRLHRFRGAAEAHFGLARAESKTITETAPTSADQAPSEEQQSGSAIAAPFDVVTITKMDLRAAINVSQRTLALRIRSGKIVLAREHRPHAKKVTLAIAQFSAEEQAAIRARASLDT
jgi:hypothetical protein